MHSVSYAHDRGLPLEQTSLALSAFGIGAVSGRLLAGAAADRFGGAGTGPALAGFVHDVTGSYTPSCAFAVLSLAVGWTLFRLGSAPRRR